MMYGIAVPLLILIVLSACASRPISNADAILAPMERILDTTYLQAALDTGEVTVKRDSGFIGSVCSSRIFVDGHPFADIRIEEKVVLYIPEGFHILSAWPTGVCGGEMADIEVTIKAGTQSSFRVGYGDSGDFFINPTAF